MAQERYKFQLLIITNTPPLDLFKHISLSRFTSLVVQHCNLDKGPKYTEHYSFSSTQSIFSVIQGKP